MQDCGAQAKGGRKAGEEKSNSEAEIQITKQFFSALPGEVLRTLFPIA